MGHYLKNRIIESGSYAARVPMGSNSLGPDSPVNGQMRFNEDTNVMEIFASSSWRTLAIVGNTHVTKDFYYGDGSTTTFGISFPYAAGQEAQILIFVGGVFQNPGTAYAVSGYTVTFTSPPNNLLPIVILQNLNSTNVLY